VTLRTSQAPTVKKAIFDGLTASPNLQGVNVTYGLGGHGDPAPPYVLVGKITWQKDEWATNRTRQEDFKIDLLIEVRLLGADPYEAEQSAAAINAAVEDWFANSPGFGLGNLVTSNYSPGALISWPEDETHYGAQVHAEVSVTARF